MSHDLLEVAQLYETAACLNIPPSTYISKRLGVTKKAARKVVERSRAAGHLTFDPTMLAVSRPARVAADALGMSVDEMFQRLREHGIDEVRFRVPERP